jgi:hypothetical protein
MLYKKIIDLFTLVICYWNLSHAEVVLDVEAFGKSLGGWSVKKGKVADYELSGSKYRTYRPEMTPTPEGGVFISIRIDYLRGIFANNDFATLEMTFGPNGELISTQSSIAIQGKKITSDVIRSGSNIGKGAGAAGSAVKMGGDLVANLTEKLSRENVVEAGRVTFPAAVRHNHNKLFQAIKVQQPQTAVTQTKIEEKAKSEIPVETKQ